MASRKSRSEPELSQAATDVNYEFQLFCQCANNLSGQVLAVFFEAYLLHARNLIEFLVGRDREAHDDDIIATDFLPNWLLPTGTEISRLRATATTIDKRLSHLTWTRLGPSPGVSEYVYLSEALVDLYAAFCDAAHLQSAPGSATFTIGTTLGPHAGDPTIPYTGRQGSGRPSGRRVGPPKGRPDPS